MATVMLMHWPEATSAQYEEARQQVDWEGRAPAGGKFHVAWFADDGLHVLDLWETAADFERFAAERLMPAVQRIGIQGEPKVEFHPVHAVFAPDV